MSTKHVWFAKIIVFRSKNQLEGHGFIVKRGTSGIRFVCEHESAKVNLHSHKKAVVKIVGNPKTDIRCYGSELSEEELQGLGIQRKIGEQLPLLCNHVAGH